MPKVRKSDVNRGPERPPGGPPYTITGEIWAPGGLEATQYRGGAHYGGLEASWRPNMRPYGPNMDPK